MGERKAPRPGRKKMMPQQTSDDAMAAGWRLQGRMEPELQDHIGRQLRAVYNEIVEEPVPDRFLKLLAELESKQNGES